ncbi:uncharacterized protein LOC143070643 [Mytilus galloprovincialis]|uniref:uncharacterized protein LOC143070643 n=1 Tax=Mytilus galloprovincialis TaxID=29158 RepID=UPI003F7BC0C0
MRLITLLFILSLMQYACFGCQCRRKRHLQEAFCGSAFVINGKVITDQLKLPIGRELQNSTVPTTTQPPLWKFDRIYDVNVTEVFKVPVNVVLNPGDVIQAVTRAEGSLCGGYLPLNTELTITGGVNDHGQVTFGLCSHTEQGLTSYQLKGLRGGYSCECLTESRSFKKLQCLLNTLPGYNTDCLLKYGVCKKVQNQTCEWEVGIHDACVYSYNPVIG